MNRLPTEILHNIFILLPIIQKQECILVCRRWAHIIRTRSLLHTITISDSNAIFKALIDMIERVPSLGSQVEHLSVGSCIKAKYDRRKLIRFFPNLKTIKLDRERDHPERFTRPSDFRGQENKAVKERRFDLNMEKTQLESIQDSDECEFTRLLLTTPSTIGNNNYSGLLTHLVKLELDLNSSSSMHRDIYPLLKDLPLLKHLKLLNPTISMDEVELIHSNLPLLTSFSLIKCDLLGRGGGGDTLSLANNNATTTTMTLPDSISPAATVTELVILIYNHANEHLTLWPHYISLKYPNLIDCIYTINRHNVGYTHDNVHTLFRQGYPFILQKMGQQLKSLDLVGIEYDETMFKALDDFGCHIENMTLCNVRKSTLNALARSEQSQYIKKLTLHQLSELPLNKSLLKRMKSLTFLYLDYNDPRTDYSSYESYESDELENVQTTAVNLNELLEHSSNTLESLTINGNYVNFDIVKNNANNETTTTTAAAAAAFPLKELLLLDVTIPFVAELDVFITKHLPYLTALKVSYASRRHNSTSLVLPKHHLDTLRLDIDMHKCQFVKLTTFDNDKTVFFDMEKEVNDFSLLGMDVAPTNRRALFNNSSAFTVICASIKELYLGGERAYVLQ